MTTVGPGGDSNEEVGQVSENRATCLIDGSIIDQADPIPGALDSSGFFSAATILNTVDDGLRPAYAALHAADAGSVTST